MLIAVEERLIETCSFYGWIEESKARKTMENLDPW